MAKQIKIDKDTCVGCGLCEITCLDVFELTTQDTASVRAEPNLECPNLKDAIDECPVSAIKLE